MKKKLALALAAGFCFFNAAESSAEGVLPANWSLYGGVGLDGSWTRSDWKMDYEADRAAFAELNSHLNQKKNSLGKMGAELFLGVRRSFAECWFANAELSYIFSRATHEYNFTEAEDNEGDEPDPNNQRIAYLKARHGDELGLSLKLGRNFDVCEVYGILGLSTKKIDMNWSLDPAHARIRQAVNASANKRVYGAIIGLGVAKKINERFSCSAEYRYKVYNSAKSSHDLKAAVSAAFGVDHDTTNRDFKIHSSKHELSLRFVVNI